jgi:hypothetical protein
MKNIMLIIFILPIIAFSQTNNINTSFGNIGYTSQTLTLSIDTADVVPAGQGSKKFDFITCVLTSSATDTITVWTLSRADTTTWVQKSLINLNSGSTVAIASLTTTAQEFLINDPQPFKVRLLLLGEDGSTTTAIVQGKYGVR